MNEILASYIEDLRDSIMIFNEALMSVQGGARDLDTVNNIFRVAHTIKGNSAAMNFLKIQKVMHTMEDILSEVRNGAREITDDMISVLFACHDFLEDCLTVVQGSESDDGMDTDVLLARLAAIKNNSGASAESQVLPKAVAEHHKPAQIDLPQDVDLSVSMPADLWELLYENIKNGGYNAYKLDIKFLKNSSMKAVRAWMIFDRLDQSGILIYSDPPRLNENSFAPSGETPFEKDSIEAVILCEREISDLVADLKNTSDIESVEARKISQDDIAKKVEFIKRQRKIINQIQEIGVELLGVDMQYIGEDSVQVIINKMNSLIAAEIAGDSSPIIIIAKRIVSGFEGALKNKRRIPIQERENIIFLCHSLEECIIEPSNMKNENLILTMYRKLDDLLDVVTSPELRVGDILTSGGLISSEDADAIEGRRRKDGALKFGQAAVKEGLVSALDVVTAMAAQTTATPTAAAKSAAGASAAAAHAQGDSGFVRVPVTKVDSLIDMLSELLIYNSQLEQITSITEVEDSKLASILSRTEKLIKEIQTLSMSLRMVEVKQTFHRLTRIARDTAADLGKKISVNLEGEDTEIDRSAIEKLFDPLMHMVRNSVSHGIENIEEDRISVGKKPEGQITISGYSKRGNVYIEVRDDGRGINTKKVYEKAREKGLISDTKEYTDEEIHKFIFLPGFSTQEKVDTISGRGVGMNVVEEAVAKLGGKIEIDSELGQGSAFRIKLPVNLAVVNGTIVEIKGSRYIIPTMCVKKFFIAKDADWVRLQGENRAIKLDDGSIVSLVSKERVFGLDDEMTRRGTRMSDSGQNGQNGQKDEKEYEMVLLEVDQKLLVLNVDKIINRQDVVSKPLAADYASVPYANSASILGDGVVSLILDIDAIFKMSQPS